MIIVKIEGGLGNQLFQYAFARGVSSRLKTEFKLDKSPFDIYYKFHKYGLDNFNIKGTPAKESDFFGFIWFKRQHKLFTFFYNHLRLKRKLLPFYFREQAFHFDPKVFLRNNTYFEGYWQTEKYFKELEQELQEEITINRPLSDYSKTILEKIKGSSAVSVHVRRGDYVTGSTLSNVPLVHGTCSMDYYKSAIEYIAERVPNPHFYIFSDDYDWSVENFKSLSYPIICINNGADKNYEDLILMSKCKHNIIANSSFSWWGAWLNRNREKIVIAPKKWFNMPKPGTNTDDIIPDTWVKL